MATLTTTNARKNGRKMSSHNIKIDMTPMVDLAFLLLTFFMLSTALLKPFVMEIQTPIKPDTKVDLPLVNEKDVLNVVLASDNKIVYFTGEHNPEVKTTNYSKEGIRKVLGKYKENPKMKILIKPSSVSTYENVVDIFDEMNIVGMNWFTLVDITAEDKAVAGL